MHTRRLNQFSVERSLFSCTSRPDLTKEVHPRRLNHFRSSYGMYANRECEVWCSRSQFLHADIWTCECASLRCISRPEYVSKVHPRRLNHFKESYAVYANREGAVWCSLSHFSTVLFDLPVGRQSVNFFLKITSFSAYVRVLMYFCKTKVPGKLFSAVHRKVFLHGKYILCP